jgi:steroid 5-alpha reductase family enzyme
VLDEAEFTASRGDLALGVVVLWCVRLTHNYFRREGGKFGDREDWRFTDYRSKMGLQFIWASFFIAYFSQHLMLVGLTLPLYGVSWRGRLQLSSF